MMKKFLTLFFVLSFFHSFTLLATPAYPKKIKVQKADGTFTTARIMGDEYDHWLQYEDGTISPRKISRKASQRPRRMRLSDVPTTGKQPVLVVLVNFSDTKFSMNSPQSYYQDYFTKQGFNQNGAQGCVAEWYKDTSGDLYQPQFRLLGPVTVSHDTKYYAGTDGVNQTYKLIQEVVPLIDDQVDFAELDTDKDGKVDNIYCIYAGYGQGDTGNTNYIWPHNAEVTDYDSQSVGTKDGVAVNRYTVSCEMNGQTNVPAGIGTFVHEFGHVLGLPDLYKTAGSETCYTPGSWDVMDVGVYNNN